MDKEKIIQQTQEYIEGKFSGEGTGHDWWHIYRVWTMAIHIANKEKVDLFIVELGALLHDIADHKFHGGDHSVGPEEARKWLSSVGADEDTIQKVCHIVEHASFKGSGSKSKMESLEGKIVQDADRLDAIGAIGIARAFAYGGSLGRPLHDNDNKKDSTVNHFYEKLLKVKDLMNTKTGKEIAEERHQYLEEYLKRFLVEWEGVGKIKD